MTYPRRPGDAPPELDDLASSALPRRRSGIPRQVRPAAPTAGSSTRHSGETAPPHQHRARHSRIEQDEISTGVLPRVVVSPDAPPQVTHSASAQDDSTAVLPRIPADREPVRPPQPAGHSTQAPGHPTQAPRYSTQPGRAVPRQLGPPPAAPAAPAGPGYLPPSTPVGPGASFVPTGPFTGIRDLDSTAALVRGVPAGDAVTVPGLNVSSRSPGYPVAEPPEGAEEPGADTRPTRENPPPGKPSDAAPTKRPDVPKGVVVVPLRPIRTEEGYRSVYAQHTRTTFGGVLSAISRGTGEVLITFGLIVLLFAAYEVWGKTAIVDAHQNDLDRQLAQDWNVPGGANPSVAPSSPPPSGAAPAALTGKAIARMYLPRINKTLAVVQGVSAADIRYAPGHYPNTAMPGQIGNFSVAGHRNRAIFWDLDQFKTGDPIVVETAESWHVYKVTSSQIVLPDAVKVVAPVPNQPGVKATEAMLTLTTCNPKFNNYQRLIVHAKLDRTQPHDKRPAEAGS